MVVLCDHNTASAAELFVANFKDYGIAKTVGATTHGKGCLQHTYGLNGGFSGAVKLTTHMYYSGGDKDLVGYDKVGIEPDVSVELGEEQTKVSINIVPHSEDAQLMAAVELFK
jgi:carboxyl-terminal processing protease